VLLVEDSLVLVVLVDGGIAVVDDGVVLSEDGTLLVDAVVAAVAELVVEL
jgi:hypothetical protein